ncbi:MAG TPA: 50S ribosomal protein L11 methyltransferase [Geopsychrobacteraceae bacterium]|nr:50S ribosomal protein L11 methyltransferase [Geopsychrobacteraceae bacterium]
MNTEWISIEISSPATAVDLVCASLAELGCGGTVIEDAHLDTFIPPDPDLDPDTIYQLKAYFEEPGNPDELLLQIKDTLENLTALTPSWQFTIGSAASVREEDWAENWKQNFSAQRVGKHLVIKPSWEEFSAQSSDRIIEIDPGMAFGTGTHGTTLLCLETIAELFDKDNPPKNLLDVGTGSGILALGAAALGCQQILACDIDEKACQVAQQNIDANNYSEQIIVTAEPLEQLKGRFDLVVANILAEENVRLGQALLNRLAPGGKLILSGILREKEEFVRQGFADYQLQSFPTRYQDDWICLIYQSESP